MENVAQKNEKSIPGAIKIDEPIAAAIRAAEEACFLLLH